MYFHDHVFQYLLRNNQFGRVLALILAFQFHDVSKGLHKTVPTLFHLNAAKLAQLFAKFSPLIISIVFFLVLSYSFTWLCIYFCAKLFIFVDSCFAPHVIQESTF